MSDWRKVVRCCPNGHAAGVGVHGPAGDGLQVAELSSPCSKCGADLQAFTFRFDDTEDSPESGRSRVYMEQGKPVAVGSVVQLSDGRLNVAVAVSEVEPRMEPGRWTSEEAEALADQWVEELFGRKPTASTPWFPDER